jgi:hypothetical protein
MERRAVRCHSANVRVYRGAGPARHQRQSRRDLLHYVSDEDVRRARQQALVTSGAAPEDPFTRLAATSAAGRRSPSVTALPFTVASLVPSSQASSAANTQTRNHRVDKRFEALVGSAIDPRRSRPQNSAMPVPTRRSLGSASLESLPSRPTTASTTKSQLRHKIDELGATLVHQTNAVYDLQDQLTQMRSLVAAVCEASPNKVE